jgi:anthranilate phosphoribosyltransferase
VIAPEDFGLDRLGAESLAGADATANARVIESILRGEPHPARGVIVLNAAAALVVAQGAPPKDAAAAAARALSSGQAMSTLERWRAAADRARTP